MDEINDETPQKGNSMMIVLGIIVVLVVVAVAVVMMKNKSQSAEEGQESMATEQAESTATNPTTAAMEESTATESSTSSDDSTVKTFNIEAGSFYYKPNVITVKKGDKVKIVMNSVDMMHDFNIDELNVKIPITKSGQTNTVEFTPTTVGTFEYYCSVGQHRANGQVGKITVTE